MSGDGHGHLSPLQVEAVLELILATAARLFEGEGSIMLLSDHDALEVVVAQGNPGAIGARVPFGQGIAGKVAASGKAVLVKGRSGKRWRPTDSAMCIPLLSQARLVGVLNLSARPGRDYSEHELSSAGVFAGMAAGAMAEARLYEKERREGAPDAHRHLAAMLKYMKSAAAVDFVEPRRTESFDVAATIRALAQEEARATQSIEVVAPRSVAAVGRPRELRRAVRELLDNAQRHGQPPVVVSLQQAGERQVVLSVADAGPGIPVAGSELVFEPFGRLDRPTDAPGLGLGLTIARRLLESMEASVMVGDTAGRRSAMLVRLARR